MKLRLPVIPTVIVVLAIATMIALGVWQLDRAGEKERLLARYSAAQDLAPVAYPIAATSDDELPLFRPASATCLNPQPYRVTGGRNRAGEGGYVQIVACGGGSKGPYVELGWSRDPQAKFQWSGGTVEGVIAPDSRTRIRLVASSPAAGLQASAPPSLDTIPNNHRLYAVQWFLFAGIGAFIYLLALRKRSKDAAATTPPEPEL